MSSTKLTGLEKSFIKFADSFDVAGNWSIVVFNMDNSPLELTEYAEDVLKEVMTPSPFIALEVDIENSKVAFFREDETTVDLKVKLVVDKD